MSTRIIPLDTIAAEARAMISDSPNAPEYECNYCGETVDSYRGAHDDAPAAIRAFIEHTAFEHTGRADILEVTRTLYARVARLGEETPEPEPARPSLRDARQALSDLLAPYPMYAGFAEACTIHYGHYGPGAHPSVHYVTATADTRTVVLLVRVTGEFQLWSY